MLIALIISTATAGTLCSDGWISSSTGRGTCSHHGGEVHESCCSNTLLLPVSSAITQNIHSDISGEEKARILADPGFQEWARDYGYKVGTAVAVRDESGAFVKDKKGNILGDFLTYEPGEEDDIAIIAAVNSVQGKQPDRSYSTEIIRIDVVSGGPPHGAYSTIVHRIPRNLKTDKPGTLRAESHGEVHVYDWDPEAKNDNANTKKGAYVLREVSTEPVERKHYQKITEPVYKVHFTEYGYITDVGTMEDLSSAAEIIGVPIDELHDTNCAISHRDSIKTIDYNGCCPFQWHAAELGSTGLICERN